MAPPPLLSLSDVSVTFGGRPLFEKVSFSLGRSDKVCLVGRNGSGKSTLLRLLAGESPPDAGQRFLQPGVRIGLLSQEPDTTGFETIFDFVVSGLPPDEQDAAHRAEAILERMKLAPERPLALLSGGKARRAALARSLVAAPDILLLDEPTNHLDLPTIEWLETELQAFRGGLLLISHDRAFLSRLSRRVLWLDRGQIRESNRPFSEFEAWQAEVFAAEELALQKLNRKLSSEMLWLREGISARRTRNMGRVRALSQLRRERAERYQNNTQAGAQVKMVIAENETSGRLVIEADRITKTFDTASGRRDLTRNFSTRILRGDCVGIIGRNGAGKTTLVKMLLGQVPPDSGSVRLGVNINIAYFDQHRVSLNPESTLRQTLCPLGGDTVQVGEEKRHVASYLRDFLFDGNALETPVRRLSGGERNRLLLAKLFSQPSNLLVMDEPTNDLDMDTLDLLEDVLSNYDGTLILVSHDRDFLDRLATSIIAVEGDGTVAEYVGGYSDYLRQRPVVNKDGPAPSGPKPASRSVSATVKKTDASSGKRKLGYQQQRELELLPQRIEQLSAEVKSMEVTIADPYLFQKNRKEFERVTSSLDQKRSELALMEERWLDLECLKESLSE
ncbi:ATP-binding protein Uup [Azospirillaceae bacterium]